MTRRRFVLFLFAITLTGLAYFLLPKYREYRFKRKLIKFVQIASHNSKLKLKDLTSFDWDDFSWFYGDSYGSAFRSACILRFYSDERTHEADLYDYL